VGSIMAVVALLVGSSIVMFTVREHLVSASSTVVVASEIGGVAFALTSAFGLSVVA
jgi:hypothetical protein